MSIKVGINGFGRIGRNILRSGWNSDDIEFVHINDLTSDDMLAYLLKNDSVHGRWNDTEAVKGGLRIGDKVVSTSAERDPSKLPWGELGVDIVLECTGVFRSRDKAAMHLAAGAKKVIISAPGIDVDGTFVYGVNHEQYDGATQHIVSNASCTTNCLAPLVKTLNDAVGIEHGMMTTIHSYTMDQNLLDGPHKNFRRSRAAAQNMVPTSTGAAQAIGQVLPEMVGKLDGMAIRVPTPNVSMVDLVFKAGRTTSVDEINAALTAAAHGALEGVLAVTREELVSSDLIGNPHSSIADLNLTQLMNGDMVKVLSWYDNEWGFSNRMLDLARHIHGA